MRRRTRRILFWVAVVVFASAFWIATRYAQGYKWDFAGSRFVRTGAIAVTANTGAKLYVDGRFAGDLSFLGERAGKDKLLPGSHTVRLDRDGYSSWHKDAQVVEGRLTDFPSALLLSETEDDVDRYREQIDVALAGSRTLADGSVKTASVSLGEWVLLGQELWRMDTASGSLIAEGVIGFSPSDNGSRVLWWTRNELWVLWLSNTDYQPFRTEGERLMLSRWSVPIVRAAWWPDREHIAVSLGKNDERVLELDERGGLNIIRF